MSAWPTKKLSEICRPRQWPTLSKAEMISSGVPVYGANGIIGYTDKPTHVTPTILIGCRGSCGTVHRLCPPGYANGNAMALDDIRSDIIDLNFLEHFLRHRGFEDVTTGASQPQIVQRNLNEIEIPLPTLDEQKLIAAILDQADELRRKRQRAIDRLNQLGQAIFHEMFGDPTANPKGWPTVPATRLARRITVGLVVKPASYYQDHGVPAIRGTNIKQSGIDLSDVVYFSQLDNETKLAKSRIWTDDIVIVRSGRPGLAAIVPPELNGANAIDVLIFSVDEKLASPMFIRDLINSEGGKRLVLSESRGQVQQHFNVGSLSEAELFLPPIYLQQEYEARIYELQKFTDKYLAALDVSNNLFASLQHRAFQGELSASSLKEAAA